MNMPLEPVSAADESGQPGTQPESVHWFNRTVFGAGLTSALGDFCYETTTVVLPGFLAVLGIPAAVLGIVEGVADGTASFTKMFSGYFADKLGHRKSLVLIGYALTPLGQGLIASAVGWPLIVLGRVVSWFGKGLRGPLRDAIVVQAITAETRGRAFGFHRAMDTLGAVAGPLTGVGLLGWAQGQKWSDLSGPFRLVLWFSVIPGVLAVLAFLTLVNDPEQSRNPGLKLFTALRGLPEGFKLYLRAVGVFGIGDFSHSLLILAATQLLMPSYGIVGAAQMAGLLYVGRNITQLVCSYPIGVLADHYGSRRVLRAGYGLGALTAATTAFAFALGTGNLWVPVLIFLLAGLYVAVQEALETTVTAEFVTKESLGTSLGAMGMVNGTTKLLASTLVGVLWTTLTPAFSFALAAALMTCGTFLLGRLDASR